MILGGFLSRIQILGVALVCAVLQEAFSNLPENEAVVRLLFSSAGFVGTGLFVSELIDAAGVTLDLAGKQVQSGYANYLALLNAEQTYQQAVLNLAQAQAYRYADTAALFEALGGGWWNRSDIPRS